MMKKTDAPILIEENIFSPINKVWEAITYLPIMNRWYFDNVDYFNAEVGSKSKFQVH